MHIAPQVQDNSKLVDKKKIKIKMLDLRILRHENWGSKSDVTLLEGVFETECGRVIVKRMTYSFDPRSDISKIYKAITGKEIDPNIGFDSNEIIGKSVFATVSKYESKGYIGTTIKNFEAIK